MSITVYKHTIKPNASECTTVKLNKNEIPVRFHPVWSSSGYDVVRYNETEGYTFITTNPSPIRFLTEVVEFHKADIAMKENMLVELTKTIETMKTRLASFEKALDNEREKQKKTFYLYRFDTFTKAITLEEVVSEEGSFDFHLEKVIHKGNEYQMVMDHKNNAEFIDKMIKHLWNKYQKICPLSPELFKTFSENMTVLTRNLQTADTAVKPYNTKSNPNT